MKLKTNPVQLWPESDGSSLNYNLWHSSKLTVYCQRQCGDMRRGPFLFEAARVRFSLTVRILGVFQWTKRQI
jgi:hypothetical protein